MIISELSNQIKKQLIAKWQKEDKYLQADDIMPYFDRFEQIKNSPKLKQFAPKYLQDADIKNIELYKKFEDLEGTVDAFPESETQKKEKLAAINNISVTDNELIYDNNDIKIFNANSFKACIKNSMGFSFCIGKPGQTQYWSYRGGEDPRSFYFVFDSTQEAKPENPTSVLVIHVFEKPKKGSSYITSTSEENAMYGITFASNSHERYYASWDNLVKEVKKFHKTGNNNLIDALHSSQELFKYVPMSADETKLALISGRHISTQEFIRLPEDLKLLYISTKTIDKDAFESLPLHLKNEYINANHVVPFTWIEFNKGLLSRYAINRVRLGAVMDSRYLDYIKDRSILNQYYEYLIKHDKAEYIKFEVLEKHFPDQIPAYLESQKTVDNSTSLYILEPEAIKYLSGDEQYVYLKYYKVINDLCLEYTEDWDAENQATKFYYIPDTLDMASYNILSEYDKSKVAESFNYILNVDKRQKYTISYIIAPNVLKQIKSLMKTPTQLPESVIKLIKEVITKVAGITGTIQPSEKPNEKEVEVLPAPDKVEVPKRRRQLTPDTGTQPTPRPMNEEDEEESDIMKKIVAKYQTGKQKEQLKEYIRKYLKNKKVV